MKILVILPRIPVPARDGGAIVMLESLEAMHAAGVDITILALNTSKHRADVATLRHLCTNIVAVDVETHPTPFGAIRNLLMPRRSVIDRSIRHSYWLERFITPATLAAAVSAAETYGPFDIMHCEQLFTLELGLHVRTELTLKKRPVPLVIYRSHNVEYRIQERMSVERGRSSIERWYRTLLARRTKRFEEEALLLSDACATLSEDDADVYRGIDPSGAIESVPPGISIPSDAMLASAQRRADTICLLASMEWAPNVEGTLWFVRQVMPLILQQRPSAVVHIAGRNPGTAITGLHNGSNVIVHGEIEDPLAFRLDAAVSIVPLFSGSGVRIKILEALGAACPLVTTTIGAEGLPVLDGTHVRIADDAASFANACCELLAQRDEATALGERGRELIRRSFTWTARMDELLSFYKRVLTP
ncbi:MAG: glycosyltransferase [Bacteroidetes bacterium]|nr:glycosyltransferase [Bacteroidota bacterium]